MSTVLTVYGNQATSTTLSTASTLATNGTGTSLNTSVFALGASTGWQELYTNTSIPSWAASGSIGSPSGYGRLLDITALEALQISAGNWNGTITILIDHSSITATFVVRAYKRSSSGTYTSIGTLTTSGVSITNGSFQSVSLPSTSLSAVSFATGDKLYIDVWCNVTAGSGNSATRLAIRECTDTSLGNSCFQINTPGFTGTPNNGSTTIGGTTGNTYQLWNLGDSTVDYYETGDEWTSNSNTSTLPNSSSGQSVAISGNALEAGPSSRIALSSATTSQLTVTPSLTSRTQAEFVIALFGGSSSYYTDVHIASNIYWRVIANGGAITLYYDSSSHGFGTMPSNGCVVLRFSWNGTSFQAGVSVSGSPSNTVPALPSLTFSASATSISQSIYWTLPGSSYMYWGNFIGLSGSSYLPTLAQLNYNAVTTSSRTTPATIPLMSAGLRRSSAATFVLKTLVARRATPATMPVKSVALQRMSPATMPLAFRANRTTPATMPLRGTFYRATVAALVLKSFGNQRTSPATMLLASLGQRRATPATLPLAFRSYRSTAASLVLKKIGISRATPASMVLVWGPRPVQIIKQQYIKVFKNDGTFICCWNDAAIMGDSGTDAPKFAVNAITNQVNITLPRLFDNFDEAGDRRGRGSVGAGNIVQIWVVDNDQIPYGRLVFQGKIDGYQPQFDTSNNESMQVLVTPFDSVLGDVKFLGTQTFGITADPQTYVDPVAMFDWPFENINQVTGQPYPYPLTLDPANPTSSGVGYSLQWSKQSITDWNEDVRTVAPQNWFWRTNHDTKTVTFTQAPTTPKHTFIIGKHLVAPQYQMTYQPLKNYVWVQGTACLAIAQGADILQFGQRTLTIVEPRIFDQYTCNRYANGTLASVDVPAFRSTITVVDYRGDVARLVNISHPSTLWDACLWDVDSWDYPTSAQLGQSAGLGYDIDRIQVGDVCQVLDPTYNYLETLWDSAIWDTDSWDYPTTGILGQAIVIVGLTYKFFTVDLELAVLQPSQDRFLVDLANQLEASQLG